MKCKRCKKELGNKFIVEVCYYERIEWSEKKDMIEGSERGSVFLYHKKCFEKVLKNEIK